MEGSEGSEMNYSYVEPAAESYSSFVDPSAESYTSFVDPSAESCTYQSAESYQYQPQENNGYYDYSDCYYDSNSQQYYSSPSYNSTAPTNHDQWYSQWFEQLYASHQQYAVPYQQHYTGSSSSSNSYGPTAQFAPRGQTNKSNNAQRKSREEPLSLFYCESCDRSFLNDMKLQEHLSEHRVCGVEGCKFTAHTKVVDNHIRMQHDTGLYRRMISNDDTEKWRAERKK